jgi:2-polyprenyl-6-methoxyphenol hydroxylase-like FAD-dependent oxidoreductase
MGARAEKLVEENGEVRGVYYRGQDGWHELRALLTVAADGRFSRVRRLAGFEPIKTAPPMDVLWFRLPRMAGDPEESGGRISGGHFLAVLNRHDYWQVGYSIPKGGYQQIRKAGLDALRQEIARIEPPWADRLETLREWKQISVLSVESNRLPRWYRPGLLLIGDAAHVMSPVGGVGINYAIQDAVVAANVLGEKLKAGKVSMRDLALVQRRREWPTRVIQGFQSIMQKQTVGKAFTSHKPFTIPLFLRFLSRLPVLRTLPARFIAFGIWPVHVRK